MTSIHIKDKPVETRVAVQGGDGYSRCPEDGCKQVDRSFKNGGVDSKGQQHLSWEMFSADRREGGCGAVWAAETQQGAKDAEKQGRDPRWLTYSAATGRSYSLAPTSDQYAENYRRAFGHD